MPKIRLYGDVSPDHENDFIFIKGVYGCKNNGEALEKMIEIVSPLARKEAASRIGVGGDK
jgi:hypothetical protein